MKTKICVFADVHGNGPAFIHAFNMICSEKADLNIFLGDLCGYYFDQRQIFEMIRSLPNLMAYQGNHDKMYLKIAQGDENLRRKYKRKYGRSLEYLFKDENHELIQWLSSLPELFSLEALNTVGCHGSPWDPLDGYVYPDTPLERFLDYSFECFFLAHTHYPMARKIKDKVILNPGSLGQPRNGGWPTYATIQFPEVDIKFREVFYDKNDLLKQINAMNGSNQYLKEVLLR
jgi:putative phosphoesterase